MSYSICVFCASSDRIAERYFDQATELGEEMARRGHRLVYGGGQVGLMGAVARAVRAGGGTVVGVTPRRLDWAEVVYADADEMIYTATMRERKTIMEQRADAFIVLPGGIGTLEEALGAEVAARALQAETVPVTAPWINRKTTSCSGAVARPISMTVMLPPTIDRTTMGFRPQRSAMLPQMGWATARERAAAAPTTPAHWAAFSKLETPRVWM